MSTKAITKTMLEWDLAKCFGTTNRYTKVTGNMALNMAKVC